MAPSGQSTRIRNFCNSFVFAYKGGEIPARAFDALCVRWMKWGHHMGCWYVHVRSHKAVVREREILACIEGWNLSRMLEERAVLHLLAGMDCYIEYGPGHPIALVLKQMEESGSALFSSYTSETIESIQEKLHQMKNSDECHKRLVDRMDEAAELARENKRLKAQIEFLEGRLEEFERPREAKGGPCSAASFLAHGIRLGTI